MRRRLLGLSILLLIGALGFWLFRERASQQPPADGSEEVQLSAEVLAAQWPAFQLGGPLHGSTVSMPLQEMRLLWECKIGKGGESSPVIAGGVVYIGGGDGIVYAIELASGKVKWTYKTGSVFSASPLVLGDILFIGDEDGVFRALSVESGQRLWQFTAESEIHSSANWSGEHVLFGSYDNHMYCLRAADGSEAWRFRADAQIHAALAVSEGMVFGGGCDQTLRAIDLITGAEKWHFEVGSVIPTAPVCFEVEGASAGRRIALGTMEGEIVCLNVADGSAAWRREIEDESFYGSCAFSAGRIVIAGKKNAYCINARTGEIEWSFTARAGFDSSPVISGEGVYVTGKDGKLHVLDTKTGKEIWSFDAGARILSSPAIGEGALVFCDSAGNIYCLSFRRESIGG